MLVSCVILRIIITKNDYLKFTGIFYEIGVKRQNFGTRVQFFVGFCWFLLVFIKFEQVFQLIIYQSCRRILLISRILPIH